MSIELADAHAVRGMLASAAPGPLPDSVVRSAFRRLCAQRLAEETAGGPAAQAIRYDALLRSLRNSPLSIHADAATGQYALPPSFFALCLGPRYKYSSCYYPTGTETLDEAELAMLALYGMRAQLADGQDILELGCGWGSLTLWMAECFPAARITAICNSQPQRLHIEAQCRVRGLQNVRVLTCDVNRLAFEPAGFDRVVSVEMFEQMRNYQIVMQRIGTWLRPKGKLFVHIFAHRTLMYPDESEGEDALTGGHFLTGSLMPAADTLLNFQQDLEIEQRWLLDGTHYEKTSNHWLAHQDHNHDAVMRVLEQVYGPEGAKLWFQRWRTRWMSRAELFGYDDGRQWLVAHYRFARPA